MQMSKLINRIKLLKIPLTVPHQLFTSIIVCSEIHSANIRKKILHLSVMLTVLKYPYPINRQIMKPLLVIVVKIKNRDS
jgi:hypothetical protein